MEQLTLKRPSGICLRLYGKDTISQDTEAQTQKV